MIRLVTAKNTKAFTQRAQRVTSSFANFALYSLCELYGLKKIFASIICLFIYSTTNANTIKVATAKDLQQANEKAKAGDTVILQNGNWTDIVIKLTCTGTEQQPILFKAETAGKVKITGKSSLKIGGSFIVVDGLNFENGYCTDNAVITFRTDKNNIANHCRITNCLINEYNKPRRLDEDYWIALYGKNNRLDHCTFRNKKNLGVLLAVILDDERSRENFHSIDHNFFDGRPPLGSNAGEIIRVGVSQHCTFNSNTIIADNYFMHCDGETEIISIKSGANIIKNNLFKECQGCVTLRHGNNNTVYNNIFLGNGKEGTGGVRIINEGNWVVNNLFYECVGVSFRSPLAIMNGVPNSPANRYLPVKDAVVANNSFINCTPFSLCEGSDTERSQVPQNVLIANNIFYNIKDSIVFYKFDDISGFSFKNNIIPKTITQNLSKGFEKLDLKQKNIKDVIAFEEFFPYLVEMLDMTITKKAKQELNFDVNKSIGFGEYNLQKSLATFQNNSGIQWKEDVKLNFDVLNVQCTNTQQLSKALNDSTNSSKKINIILTGNSYEIIEPIKIYNQVKITSNNKTIKFVVKDIDAVFIVQGNASLNLSKLNIDAGSATAKCFVSSPTNQTVNHYSFTFSNSSFKNFKSKNSSFFSAEKSSYADSISISNNIFDNNNTTILSANREIDKKGYYNAEVIKINKNKITDHTGSLAKIARTGNDESTMGPKLWLMNNNISNVQSTETFIQLNGVQYSNFQNNIFTNINKEKALIDYTDIVRAIHIQSKNNITNCGVINQNNFVINK